MTYNRIHPGLLCMCIAAAGLFFFFNTPALKAQQVKNVLAQNVGVDFSNVKVGATQCFPLTAINTENTAITISRLKFSVGSQFFTLKDTLVLPVILQAKASLNLGTVCFTSKAANKEYVGYININFSSQPHSDNGEIRLHATTEIDSSLLLPCFTVTFDSSLFAPVFYGGMSFRTMNVTNNKDTLKTIRCIDITVGDAKAFTGIRNNFPIDIPPHQMRQIHLAFAPISPAIDGSNNFRSKVKIEAMDGTAECSPDFDIYGTAIVATDMGTINPFDRTSILPILKMSGTDNIFGQTFLFQNTDNDTLLINALSLDGTDSAFSLEPMGACSTLPMFATPDEYLAARITLQTTDSNIHYTKLRFTLGKGLPPIIYNVEAMRILPQASLVRVMPNSTSFTFTAIPNPSSGNITIEISGTAKASIEIFDAAGKLVISQSEISAWTWNGKNSSGINVPSGNYFIRASIRDAIGKEITKTEQVAIVR